LQCLTAPGSVASCTRVSKGGRTVASVFVTVWAARFDLAQWVVHVVGLVVAVGGARGRGRGGGQRHVLACNTPIVRGVRNVGFAGRVLRCAPGTSPGTASPCTWLGDYRLSNCRIWMHVHGGVHGSHLAVHQGPHQGASRSCRGAVSLLWPSHLSLLAECGST
jgi:hypothetical protein